jgi:hypothetical protein
MTKKDDLQAELLAKVKPGTKPSHLKRSKSESDIPSPLNKGLGAMLPKAPPLPLSELEQLKKENEQLRQSLSAAKQEQQATSERLKELHDFAKSDNTSALTNPTQALSQLTGELKKQADLNTLLSEQLKEKQREVESLRKQLEATNNSPKETLSELDHSLMARHQSLKD